METAASSEQLFATRLKKLEAEFDFFAHVASHDLRDPLRQAHIYGEELLKNLHGDDKEKLSSMNLLINEVLQKIAILRDYSYIANDKSPHVSVDLNEILNEVIGGLDDKIKAKSAEIRLNPMPTITGNAKHLARLFSCLIDNALKFHEPGIAPIISIMAEKEADAWHFMVMDNGIGLDKVYRELVFVLFQRLNNEAKDGSYGMGLAFARKIVENHGGTIWYESDEESGTIFHFTLRK
jgi:light-regulated signal transduction histidine kinase (bacteriophytochrome)